MQCMCTMDDENGMHISKMYNYCSEAAMPTCPYSPIFIIIFLISLILYQLTICTCFKCDCVDKKLVLSYIMPIYLVHRLRLIRLLI